ncbi:MAG: sulfatase-like hydrolase/transferase, partial [Opitutaceae bacterium]|nr:sulfatase-like hydrolase/transferase [Opitutaceae bacterium]
MRYPILITLLGACFLAFGAAASPSSDRPNFVLCMTDDHGWGDVGYNGHPVLKTPNLDAMAAACVRFDHFYAAHPVCSPTRASVLTGRTPDRFRCYGWGFDLPLREVTVAELLKTRGYTTGHFGKWHLSNNMIPDSPMPKDYGYDEYGAFNCAGEQMPVHQDATRAIAFIEKCVTAKKPFFVNVWMHEPHTPFHTLPDYRRRFPDLNDTDNVYASVVSHADDRIGEL